MRVAAGRFAVQVSGERPDDPFRNSLAWKIRDEAVPEAVDTPHDLPLAPFKRPAEIMGGHCLREGFVRRFAERKRTARMNLEPVLQCFPQLVGHRDVTDGFFDGPVLFFLANGDFAGFEVDFFDSRTEHFASACSRVSDEHEYGVDPRNELSFVADLAAAGTDVREKLFGLRHGQEQRVPQFRLFVVAQFSSCDLPFNLLPRLERRFLATLGVFEISERQGAGDKAAADAPLVPDACQRPEFLLDCDLTDVVARTGFLGGACFDIRLQLGRNLADVGLVTE